jgi:hypothetical protein
MRVSFPYRHIVPARYSFFKTWLRAPDGYIVAWSGGIVAELINRVEREFILVAAAESGTAAKLSASGRYVACRIAAGGAGGLGLSVSGAAPRFAPREKVSLHFDFRGQAIALEAPVVKSANGTIELGPPEAMYRSLSRRWARVRAPRELSVEFLLPDAELKLDCPESGEWRDVELPELREGLDSSSLNALIDSFKAKAKSMASEGRVVMYKDKGPSDLAEEVAARLGRALYVPSTTSPLPIVDPYPAGRIVTRDMAEDFDGPEIRVEGSRLSSYLRERALTGLKSGLWCPVVFYRYSVGVVIMANGPDRPRALDFAAVDLAWEFSSILAWFLRRHGYFSDASVASAPRAGEIIDASPVGLLATMPSGGPRLAQGTMLRLRLKLKDRSLVCSGKVARRYTEGGHGFFGIAFAGLSLDDQATLSRALYGDEAEAEPAGGA